MLHGYVAVQVNGVEVLRRTLAGTARRLFGERPWTLPEVINVQPEQAS
jgi:hypothetical protein